MPGTSGGTRVVSRRGVVLVVMAVIIFALFGLAAMVIDLGIFRLTRVQMNSATESAALEGMRYADTLTDVGRRIRASKMVADIFDDTTTTWGGSQPGTLGAGPVYAVTGGVSDLRLGALLEPEVADPGDPAIVVGRLWRREIEESGVDVWLELNEADNEFYGDLVSGIYDESQSHADFGPQGAYDRPDFQADANVANDDAFLARMRRTRGGVTPRDREDGVSSSGPPIPYVFARASMAQTGPTGFNPREDGMTVRSTAIAQEKRTKMAGPVGYSDGDGTVLGVAAFGLDVGFWNGLNNIGGSDAIQVTGSGQLDSLLSGSDVGHVYRTTELAVAIGGAGDPAMVVSSNAGFPVTEVPFRVRVGAELMRVTAVAGPVWVIQRGVEGTTASAHGAGERVTLSAPSWMGLPLAPNAGVAATLLSGVEGSTEVFLVPLYNQVTLGPIPSIVEVIVGFGLVEVTDLPPPFPPGTYGVTRIASEVVARNTSPVFPRSWFGPLEGVLGSTLTEADLDALFGQHEVVEDPALSAALVRAYGP